MYALSVWCVCVLFTEKTLLIMVIRLASYCAYRTILRVIHMVMVVILFK